jgi:hypothetical protein
MASLMNSRQILDREYLEIRAKILELAASLDRMQRSGGLPEDPRIELIGRGLDLLQTDVDNRAEQVQLLFSRAYENDWRSAFGL